MKNSLLVASLFAAAVSVSVHAQSPATGGSGASAATPPAPGSAQQGGPRGSADKPHHGRHHGQMDAQKMVDHHIASLDTDKDGKVSRQEFLARQSEAFSKADGNTDGFVTREELAAQHEKHHADMAAARDARRAARGGPNAAPGGSAGSAPPATSGAPR